MLGSEIINAGNPRARRGRGFTLVELIVALSAGVLVALASLILAKNATHFFQHEARISAAQLAATMGMNRLTADLQRASFLASPNHGLGTDPRLCKDGVVLPPTILGWTGLGLKIKGSALAHPVDLAQGKSADNNLNPDSVTIGGSLATTEQFTIKDMPAQVGAYQVKLLTGDNEAMGRLRSTALKAGLTLNDALQPIFKAGRFLRVLDANGNSMYAIIRTATCLGVAPNEDVTVTLDPALHFPDRNLGTTCGIKAISGYQASVVYQVRYDIRSLKGVANYSLLVAPSPLTPVAISGEDTRTELVRVELDETGAEVASSLELVSEFAVDLKFGVTKTGLGFNPTTSSYPFDDPEVELTPELIRAVQVRFATRTRLPDRETPLSAGNQPYRFAVAAAPLTPRFARIRSLYTTVFLPNQAGFAP